MFKLLVTAVLIAAWHFPTTFFVPAASPNEKGWIIWPFGQRTAPALDAFGGVLAPATLPATQPSPTVALVAASVASLAFILAIAGVWGFALPGVAWQVAALVGAAASVALFAIYFGPLALLPLFIDAVVVWLVFSPLSAAAPFGARP